VSERSCVGCGADLSGSHGKRKWCSEHCRKSHSYGRECEVCGQRTTGTDGAAKAPKVCRACIEDRGERNRKKVGQLWDEGIAVARIAEETGLSVSTVRTIVQGVNRRKLRHLPHSNAAERYAWIGRRIIEGKTNAEIAAELGTTAGSVKQMAVYARRNGYYMPYRWEVRRG
jgi:DNA-directed RNA polymerase specialized sigma24 family protein